MGWFIPLLIAGGATGLGMGMKGQYEAGKAAERQAKDEATMGEYAAKLSEREATEERESAAYEETKHRKAGERLKARQRVSLGKAGVLPTGSALDIMTETATELEMDALMIRRGGQVGAQSLTASAALSRMGGRAALLRGRAARSAGKVGAIGSGLSGAAELGYMGYKMRE